MVSPNLIRQAIGELKRKMGEKEKKQKFIKLKSRRETHRFEMNIETMACGNSSQGKESTLCLSVQLGRFPLQHSLVRGRQHQPL